MMERTTFTNSKGDETVFDGTVEWTRCTSEAVDCVTLMSRESRWEDMPFLWDEMRYIARNHFTSRSLVFSNIVPTRQEKFLLHRE